MTGKLVRDGVPSLMHADGLAFEEHRLGDAAFLKALGEKLVEEADEVRVAQTLAERTEELADLMEVAMALARASGISQEAIEAARLQKLARRGGFDARIYLVTDGDPTPVVTAPGGR